jgi:hypothetical protein
MRGKNPPPNPVYKCFGGDLLAQPATSHHIEYIYLTCYTSILQKNIWGLVTE